MKTAIVFFVMATLLTLTGCLNMNGAKPSELFAQADLIYDDIKTIVTDKDVRPLISDDVLLRLKKAETIYLAAREGLNVPGVVDPVDGLVESGQELISILDTFVLEGRYKKEIAGVRVISKVLMNRIKIYKGQKEIDEAFKQ